jgi:hypothetical protein
MSAGESLIREVVAAAAAAPGKAASSRLIVAGEK